MLYGWRDTRGCRSFTKSLLLIEPSIWPKEFERWFVSPKDFFTLLYCPFFAFWFIGDFWHSFASPNVVSWHNSAIWVSFADCSPHNGCWYIFSRHQFSCAMMSEAVTFLSHKLVDSDEIVLCSCRYFWSTSLHYFWSCFVPIPDVSYNLQLFWKYSVLERKKNAFKSIFQDIWLY